MYISIGKIIGTQGREGEVRVLPLTDFPERFLNMKHVCLFSRNTRRNLFVEAARLYRQFVVMKLKGIDDMEAAVSLKGSLVQVTRDELVPLPSENYYIFEVIGLAVFTEEGLPLGKVSEVLKTGANDVYIIETGEKPILIPALRKVVTEIDLKAGRMTVKLPEGLL
ncbi:MAG: 16S rRNA processing protein RimM [Peptococcaceae bacterium]|jgi:16S rRNA processing protein RimM|nr:MAG: 16S rRNA processing protein RimM [Peptococcaceae bacterium]